MRIPPNFSGNVQSISALRIPTQQEKEKHITYKIPLHYAPYKGATSFTPLCGYSCILAGKVHP